MGLTRYCCRCMLLTHVDLIESCSYDPTESGNLKKLAYTITKW